jgi:uncharacterized membrane protein
MSPRDEPEAAPDDGPVRRGRLDAETLYSLLLVVLLGGLAAASYAAYEVINPAAAAVCSVNSKVSCATVANSGHTSIGIPGVLLIPDWTVGILGYAAMFVIALLAYRTFDRQYLKILAALSGIALLFVAYLVYTETVVIGAICPVCTTAHILDAVAFGITLQLLRMSRPGPDEKGSVATPS